MDDFRGAGNRRLLASVRTALSGPAVTPADELSTAAFASSHTHAHAHTHTSARAGDIYAGTAAASSRGAAASSAWPVQKLLLSSLNLRTRMCTATDTNHSVCAFVGARVCDALTHRLGAAACDGVYDSTILLTVTAAQVRTIPRLRSYHPDLCLLLLDADIRAVVGGDAPLCARNVCDVDVIRRMIQALGQRVYDVAPELMSYRMYAPGVARPMCAASKEIPPAQLFVIAKQHPVLAARFADPLGGQMDFALEATPPSNVSVTAEGSTGAASNAVGDAGAGEAAGEGTAATTEAPLPAERRGADRSLGDAEAGDAPGDDSNEMIPDDYEAGLAAMMGSVPLWDARTGGRSSEAGAADASRSTRATETPEDAQRPLPNSMLDSTASGSTPAATSRLHATALDATAPLMLLPATQTVSQTQSTVRTATQLGGTASTLLMPAEHGALHASTAAANASHQSTESTIPPYQPTRPANASGDASGGMEELTRQWPATCTVAASTTTVVYASANTSHNSSTGTHASTPALEMACNRADATAATTSIVATISGDCAAAEAPAESPRKRNRDDAMQEEASASPAPWEANVEVSVDESLVLDAAALCTQPIMQHTGMSPDRRRRNVLNASPLHASVSAHSTPAWIGSNWSYQAAGSASRPLTLPPSDGSLSTQSQVLSGAAAIAAEDADGSLRGIAEKRARTQRAQADVVSAQNTPACGGAARTSQGSAPGTPLSGTLVDTDASGM